MAVIAWTPPKSYPLQIKDPGSFPPPEGAGFASPAPSSLGLRACLTFVHWIEISTLLPPRHDRLLSRFCHPHLHHGLIEKFRFLSEGHRALGRFTGIGKIVGSSRGGFGNQQLALSCQVVDGSIYGFCPHIQFFQFSILLPDF